MKNKKEGLYIIFVAIILGLAIIYNKADLGKLSADSGFDSSWDSGGSDWSSSSDWDSSSDWGSDYSGGYYSGDDGIMPLIIVIVAISVVLVIKYREYLKETKEQNNKPLNENQATINKILKEIPGFNINEFKKEVLDNFISVQEAWMNFDYDKLQSLLTDELYIHINLN